MKTITLDEVKKLPPLNSKEIESIKNFVNTDYEDCPKQTLKELKEFRPWHELYKPTKTDVHIRVDSDVLEWFKSQGKGYQTKMNAVLRAYAFSDQVV